MREGLVHLAAADDIAPNGHPGTEVLAPGKAVLQSPEAWALRINARWRQSIENYFETGDLLIDAKNTLPYGDFEAMVATKLLFHPSTARRLMIIAKDQRLRAHVHALPASWGTIYELTKLSDEELDRGFEAKIINAEMERADVERIRPRSVLESSSAVEPDAVNVPVAGSIPASPANSDTGEPPAPTPQIHETDLEQGARANGGSPVSEAPMPRGGLAIAHNRIEPTDGLDFFPTPPWATRALFEHVLVHLQRRGHCKFQNAWEPACGEGHMAEVLKEYFRGVLATDIHDYGYGDEHHDFFAKGAHPADWIITNPPFNDSVDFVLKALSVAGTGVGMFVRAAWLEGVDRYERIFSTKPPTLVSFFTERVPLHKGRWEPEGATFTAYIWLVWLKGAAPQAPFWIPPGCRERLTKPDDVKRFGKSVVEAS